LNSAKKQGLAKRKEIKTVSVQRPKPAAPLLHWTQRRHWTVLAYLGALLPLCLLWHGNNAFYLDWKNHLWGIGYYGEYFRRHWTFPITLNTEQIAGLPYPIFYGYLFYPAAGLISAFTGCSFALRFICSLVFLLQVRQVNRTAEAIAGNRLVAGVVTVLVSFATYPLTNLYNRTAIPEFIAASLVVSVCAMWLRIVQMDDPHRRRRLTFVAALTLAFAMGTHPITAILGGSMVGLLILSYRGSYNGHDLRKNLGAAAALIAVVMAPWIYAVACFGNKVQLSGGWIYVFSNSVDRFITRFSLLPWDPRTGHPELNQLGTSYLDAQINLAMLILAIYLLYRASTQTGIKESQPFRLALGALAGFAFVCFASLSEWFWSLLPNSLKFIQFAYRLVTYADLFLFFAVLFLLAGIRRTVTVPDRPLLAVLAVCLLLSTASVGVKLIHAHRVEEPNLLAGSEWNDEKRDALRALPASFYGVNGYAVKSAARGAVPPGKDLVAASFPIGAQERFGEVLPLPIYSNPSGIIRTNVQIFPWNHLIWNGREIPLEEIATNKDLITILSGQPGAGTLEYVLRPDPIWLVLRFLSLWTAVLWAAALPAWYYFTWKKTGSESIPPGFRT
jgi:hypothetical protein